MAVLLTACGTSGNIDAEKTSGSDGEEQIISISSTDLKDGIWSDIITNTAYGENKSPQLSWNAVNGAGCYAIIMIDPDGHNWLHWIEKDVTDNEIPQGYSSADKYIGPYPPAGTHHYKIYVYALKESRDISSAKFDGSGNDINRIADELSKSDSGENNCLGWGMIEGTYTAR